jgi:hypothetical protein
VRQPFGAIPVIPVSNWGPARARKGNFPQFAQFPQGTFGFVFDHLRADEQPWRRR